MLRLLSPSYSSAAVASRATALVISGVLWAEPVPQQQIDAASRKVASLANDVSRLESAKKLITENATDQTMVDGAVGFAGQGGAKVVSGSAQLYALWRLLGVAASEAVATELGVVGPKESAATVFEIAQAERIKGFGDVAQGVAHLLTAKGNVEELSVATLEILSGLDNAEAALDPAIKSSALLSGTLKELGASIAASNHDHIFEAIVHVTKALGQLTGETALKTAGTLVKSGTNVAGGIADLTHAGDAAKDVASARVMLERLDRELARRKRALAQAESERAALQGNRSAPPPDGRSGGTAPRPVGPKSSRAERLRRAATLVAAVNAIAREIEAIKRQKDVLFDSQTQCETSCRRIENTVESLHCGSACSDAWYKAVSALNDQMSALIDKSKSAEAELERIECFQSLDGTARCF